MLYILKCCIAKLISCFVMILNENCGKHIPHFTSRSCWHQHIWPYDMHIQILHKTQTLTYELKTITFQTPSTNSLK